jgi:polysaccharide deacetylase 2 family uncharacterized protein YibQ
MSDRMMPRAEGSFAVSAAGPARSRSAFAVVMLGALVSVLGGLTGAHLALSSADPEQAMDQAPVQVAHVSLAIPQPAPDRAAPAKAAATPVPDGGASAVPDEAALARLYEEPLPEAPAKAKPARPAVEAAPTLQLANLPVPRARPTVRPTWQRYAVPVSVLPGQAMVAIVIDDLGLNRPAARRAIGLPGPLTLSFMTYAHDLSELSAGAHAAGHELLLHVPMQPTDPAFDPGPKVLRADLSDREIRRRLDWALGRFGGFVGINNHMGSKFTQSAEAVGVVMRELRARDLLFLDSMTTADSVAWNVAGRTGVPYARRDVFLDNDWRNPAAIRRQLDHLEKIARLQGFAVGIGHPHRATLDVLAKWLPQARRHGLALVPISAIVRHQIEIAHKAGGKAG